MLTEFAFTPSVFDENAHEDKDSWALQLMELGSAMFPRTAAWPVVVADLYAGSWFHETERVIESITDQTIRIRCQQLFTNIKKTIVTRPACGEWPEDDLGWGREAIASHQFEPIERIVATSESCIVLREECNEIRDSGEILDAGFWTGIRSDASPRMAINEQVELLRKLCLHAQWVALVNPYAWNTELDFTLGLIDRILDRPEGFCPVSFELHTKQPDVFDDLERQESMIRIVSNLKTQIERRHPQSNDLKVYFWPDGLDRVLVAGQYTNITGGGRRK